MRTFEDRFGKLIELGSLTVISTALGRPGEGSAEQHARYFMAFVAPRRLRQFGTTAQLFIPSERFDREELLEAECVIADLDCDWAPPSAPRSTGYSELTLLWFQDERDPFEALREQLARINWEKVAAFQEF